MNKIYDIQAKAGNIYLYDQIGYNPETGKGIDGRHVAEVINYLNEYDECEEINIRINSGGGYVMDGYSIYSAMMSSNKPVNTYVDFIAGSIAGVLAMAGKKRYISDFGKIMIHNPFSEKGGDSDAINEIRDSILTTLENNTKMERSEIESAMAVETWYKAKDAERLGFVDEVISTKRDFSDVQNIANASLMAIMNKAIFKPQIEYKMEKVLNFLSLDKEANEEAILDKVKNLSVNAESVKNELEEVKNSLTEKESELEAIKNELKAEKRKVVIAKIDNAIENGLLKAENKAELIEKFENNIEGLDLVIESVGVKPVKVMNSVATPSNEVKSLRDLEKNNPEEVERIKNEEPELYAVMFKKQYGVELKK